GIGFSAAVDGTTPELDPSQRTGGVRETREDGQAMEALKAIGDGTNYLVTGLNDADVIGSLGLDRTVEILDGKKPEKDTVVPSPRVTKENAEKYYDPKGNF
ncbi:hypothetical protein ACWGCP_35480, partial [Streptomyces niveus]